MLLFLFCLLQNFLQNSVSSVNNTINETNYYKYYYSAYDALPVQKKESFVVKSIMTCLKKVSENHKFSFFFKGTFFVLYIFDRYVLVVYQSNESTDISNTFYGCGLETSEQFSSDYISVPCNKDKIWKKAFWSSEVKCINNPSEAQESNQESKQESKQKSYVQDDQFMKSDNQINCNFDTQNETEDDIHKIKKHIYKDNSFYKTSEQAKDIEEYFEKNPFFDYEGSYTYEGTNFHVKLEVTSNLSQAFEVLENLEQSHKTIIDLLLRRYFIMSLKKFESPNFTISVSATKDSNQKSSFPVSNKNSTNASFCSESDAAVVVDVAAAAEPKKINEPSTPDLVFYSVDDID